MRLGRDRNDSVEALALPHVVVDPYGTGRLDDSSDSAKRSGIEQNRQAETEATFGAASIFRAVGAIDAVEIVIG